VAYSSLCRIFANRRNFRRFELTTPSTGVSLASPQFAISRPFETAKSWPSLPLNAELLGCPKGGLFSTVANSPMCSLSSRQAGSYRLVRINALVAILRAGPPDFRQRETTRAGLVLRLTRRNGSVRYETECSEIVYSVRIGPPHLKSLLSFNHFRKPCNHHPNFVCRSGNSRRLRLKPLSRSRDG
jgi:hypothetical protein